MKQSILCDEVLITLRRIMRAVALRSKQLVQKCGLTSPQMVILKEIFQLGEIGVGILAKNVNLSQATVTSILDRLEARGMVVRVRSQEDKRKVFVALSPLGKRTLEASPPLLHEEFVQEFEKLEEWEQLMILSNLQRIASMMNAKAVEAIPVLDPADLDQPIS